MTHVLRLSLCWVLKFSGLNSLFRWVNRNRVLILWYHGISRSEIPELKGYDERHISRNIFRQHLRYLAKRGYHFISLEQFLEARLSGVTLRRAVVLTFDDGFRNVIENAVPLMREMGAQGTIYVVVESARSGNLIWTDQVEFWVRAQPGLSLGLELAGGSLRYSIASAIERQFAMKDIKRRLRGLEDRDRSREIARFYETTAPAGEFQIASFEELRAVEPSVLKVAGHTMHHPNLTRLKDNQEFDLELIRSKEELEAATAKPIHHFAYPAGAFDENVVNEVRKAGYKTAVTTISGLNDFTTDPFKLKRVGTNSSFLQFEAMTSGAYFFISRMFRTSGEY